MTPRSPIVIVTASCWITLGATAAAAQCTTDRGTEIVALQRNSSASATERLREQVVRHRSQGNGGDEVVTEIYSQSLDGGRLALTMRIRCLTTITSYGSHTVEEMEALNPVAPNDPLRVVRRSLTTVRRFENDSYVIEREVFERDVNGRFVPVLKDRTRVP